MKKVTIYTDGACSGNPGAGGYGVVLIYNNVIKELSGFDAETTNNRMELYACVVGLSALKTPCYVTLYSDSAYLCNAFNQDWITSWQLKDWRTASKKPVKNVDLWQQILTLCAIHTVNFVKVKGHADNKYNERCDFLATNEIKKRLKNTPT